MRPSTKLILAASLALLAGAPAHAQFGGPGVPIGWAADSVEVLDAENLIRLVGRVNVRQGEARLAADEMSIFLRPAASGQDREVDRIEAAGSVVYVTPLETARGDHGVYVASPESITLTGNVTVIRGDSTLAGEELVIEPSSGRSSITRQAAGAPPATGRVRGVISTEEQAPGGSSPESSAAPASGGAL